MKICEYFNRDMQIICVLYDEKKEEIITFNCDTNKLDVIKEVKNMNTDLLIYIGKSFSSFVLIHNMLEFTEEDEEYVTELAKDGAAMFEQLRCEDKKKENNL